MKDKENPFKIVGGKDHKPEEAKREEKAVSDGQEYGTVSHYPNLPGELLGKMYEDEDINKLVDRFVDVLYVAPPIGDLDRDVVKELLEQEALEARGMTVIQLRNYLSRHDIWQRPSATKAVLDEVADRIQKQDFSPKK